MALALGAPVGAAARTAGDFYAVPRALERFEPGELVRSESITAPAGAKAWRVLYRSESVAGDPIAVSGVVVAPTGRTNRPRPVVTWAHGTTGVADRCAPSQQPDVAAELPFVGDLVGAGYVVAATDYEGLGTEGVHPYLVGQSEGRGVLDAARAARDLRATGAGKQVLVLGHSQGGQAALFAGELAARYAPDVDLAGVVAMAPVTDLAVVVGVAASIPRAAGYAVMAATGFEAAYTEARADTLLTPDAAARASLVDTACAGEIVDAFAATQGSVFAVDPRSTPPFDQLIAENTPGRTRTGAPVLIAHGTADTLVPVALSQAFVPVFCSVGNEVELRTYPDATHGSVLPAAQADVLAWFAARLTGAPASSSCAGR